MLFGALMTLPPLETVERLVGVVCCGRGLPGSSGCWFVLVALQHFLYTIKVCLSLSLSLSLFLCFPNVLHVHMYTLCVGDCIMILNVFTVMSSYYAIIISHLHFAPAFPCPSF